MVTQVELRYFKCFEFLTLPLRQLTLLSGSNASGKSSVLQAFCVLNQTMRDFEWSPRLMLNGSVVTLGTVMDIVDQVHGRGNVHITLVHEDIEKFHWVFEGGPEGMSMDLKDGFYQLKNEDKAHFDTRQLLHYLSPNSLSDHSLIHRLRKMTYLTAERLGPREYYPYDDPLFTSTVGSCGEHTASILYNSSSEPVLEQLVVTSSPPTRLRQVESRLASFFPGCTLELTPVERANAISIGIRMSNETKFLRPVNSGFGLTQVLPIIVAALSAEKGDFLLIENPEVHLHPAGQSQMGRFLAEIASAGIQIMIETHSDHILNGIRRAVKDNMISHKNVAFHFFRQRELSDIDGEPQVESPRIDSHGNVDYWPSGFFDQFDNDMLYFLGR